MKRCQERSNEKEGQQVSGSQEPTSILRLLKGRRGQTTATQPFPKILAKPAIFPARFCAGKANRKWDHVVRDHQEANAEAGRRTRANREHADTSAEGAKLSSTLAPIDSAQTSNQQLLSHAHPPTK